MLSDATSGFNCNVGFKRSSIVIVAAQFEGDYKLNFHLAPPTLNKAAKNGEPKKSKYGPWMMPAFRVLAKLRRYRGTALDIFARSPERKMERALIGEYEAVVAEILDRMTPQNYPIAVDLASIPEHIRGYGHVKDRHLKDAKVREKALLAQLRDAKAPAVMAPVIVHAG